MYVCMHICMYICMYIRIYAYTYICIYVYMYICIISLTSKSHYILWYYINVVTISLSSDIVTTLSLFNTKNILMKRSFLNTFGI